MPPRTRGSKTKTLKENKSVVVENKLKIKHSKVTKIHRKALKDKTNSVSDDDMSIQKQKQVITSLTSDQPTTVTESESNARPRRERRLPTRYKESDLLNNLSNSKNDTELESHFKSDSEIQMKDTKTSKLPVKPSPKTSPVSNSFKTPQKVTQVSESSLVVNRPRRLCRLPSKFDDHSLSPTKSVVVQPCHASTPILQNKTSKTNKNLTPNKSSTSKNLNKEKDKISPIKKTPQKRHIQCSKNTNISDTNNNANKILLRARSDTKIPHKNISVKETVTKQSSKKALNKINNNYSFKVLEEKPSSDKYDNPDVYEFTYDPNEEPPPKKKRKRVTKKKPAQAKTVIFKNNYNANLNKALAALKTVVTKKVTVPAVEICAVNTEKTVKALVNVNKIDTKKNNHENIQTNIQDKDVIRIKPTKNIQNVDNIINQVQNVESIHETINNLTVQGRNFNSIRVEDIAADFELDMDHDINYSPVNSPHRPNTQTQEISSVREERVVQPQIHNKDPLNLQEDLSFFDDIPVASSSMNISVRQAHASPWRVEFGNLPIKWHANTYVKSNMTPAVESSFINSEENTKKHVYTNMLPQSEDILPVTVLNSEPNLKQTSIISFIKEVAEKNAAKKRRGKSDTPTKVNKMFEDLSNMPGSTHTALHKTPTKGSKKIKEKVDTPNKESVDDLPNSSNDKENQYENLKKANVSETTQKDKNATFFGFDDSEDQENVSPIKINNPRVLALRSRARAALQEMNAQSGPTRALLPVAAKSKIAPSSDTVNQIYEGMKSATDAPIIPDKQAEAEKNRQEITNTNNISSNSESSGDESQSVHLFEDLEIIHHQKPLRKSYGKSKKVTFRQRSVSNSDVQDSDAEQSVSSDEGDLTFTFPKAQPKKNTKNTRKKPSKKQNKAKKEEEAAEAWAAGFNSMCEDIEEFPLLVE
ncbi:uncharacterized protein LOC131851725 [Achroia grisella]|uniref:uncharacterized protein LOC131851725 n=1 Tax=Achroia grisella TaxID=688607 RepID=UPI0027D29D94|nr:uncharacterized protein LOC131851725 [Achroia grisella]